MRSITTTLEFPLLKCELLGLLRTRKSFWMVFIIVGIAGLISLVSWPGAGGNSSRDGALWVFMAFAMTLLSLSLALLIVPAFASTSITTERERNTFELLYSTLLPPWAIIVSKILTLVGYVLILLIATMPCVLVLHLMGGVSRDVVLMSYFVIFSAVVMCATGCLAVSMRSKTTAQAVVGGLLWVLRWTFGWHFLISIGLWIVLWGTDGFAGNRGPAPWFMTFYLHVWACSPFGALGLAIAPDATGGFITFPPSGVYLMFASVVFLVQFCLLLRRIRTPDLSVHTSRPLRRSGKVRRPMSVRALRVFDEYRIWGLSNPIFLKEMSTEFFGRLWFRRVSFWATLLFLVVIASIGKWHVETAVFGAGYVCMVLAYLIAPAVAASSFTRESEQGNLDLLRGTLLSMRSILTGKLLASFMVILIAAVVDNDSWRGLTVLRVTGTYVLILGVSLFFLLSLATFFSVISRRTLGALLGTYVTMVLVYIAFPIFVLITGLADSDFIPATNPFVAYATGVEGGRLGLEHMVSFTICHGLAGLALWALAVSLVDRVRGRD